METLSRISTKKLMGAVRAPKEGTDWLYEIWGVANVVLSGEGDKGPWKAFQGDFVAITLKPVGREKEIVIARATDLYVPTIVENKLIAAGVGVNGQFVGFGFKIGVSSKGDYVAESLMAMVPSSPVEAILAANSPDLLTKIKTPPATGSVKAKQKAA